VQVPDFAIWRFKDGQVVEISTIQDQFALLKQIGYLPAKSTRRSRPSGTGLPEGASPPAPAQEGAGPVLSAAAAAARLVRRVRPIGRGR
jgi:hypothetical protein